MQGHPFSRSWAPQGPEARLETRSGPKQQVLASSSLEPPPWLRYYVLYLTTPRYVQRARHRTLAKIQGKRKTDRRLRHCWAASRGQQTDRPAETRRTSPACLAPSTCIVAQSGLFWGAGCTLLLCRDAIPRRTDGSYRQPSDTTKKKGGIVSRRLVMSSSWHSSRKRAFQK